MRGRVTLVLFGLALAGCAAPATTTEDAGSGTGSDVQQLTWKLWEGTIARGSPSYAADAEGVHAPFLATAADGTLFLQFTGCTNGALYFPKLLVAADMAEPPFCVHAPVMRSADDGNTWVTLNDENGRLSPDAPASNFGGGVSVDDAGVVYVVEESCLTSNVDPAAAEGCSTPPIVVQKSADGGETWTNVGAIRPEWTPTAGASIAAGEAGHVVVAWKTVKADGQQLWVSTTFDGGSTFTEPVNIEGNLDNVGSLVIDEARGAVYAPYPVGTQSEPPMSELRVAVSKDRGRTWSEVSTAIILEGAPGSFPCQQGTPSMSVQPDGTLVLAFTARQPSGNFALKLTTSADGAKTWSTPMQVGQSFNNAVPRLANDDENILLAWGTSEAPIDEGEDTIWALQASLLSKANFTAVSAVVDKDVARGLQSNGTILPPGRPLTPLNGGVAGNDVSAILSFASVPLRDGGWAIIYVDHPLERGGVAELHAAIGD